MEITAGRIGNSAVFLSGDSGQSQSREPTWPVLSGAEASMPGALLDMSKVQSERPGLSSTTSVPSISASTAQGRMQRRSSQRELSHAGGLASRSAREAWLMKHPEFPNTRPGIFKALLMGLTQAAQSWHMHEAATEVDHEKNKKIIISEATNGALVAALFLTVSTATLFDGDGAPDNGMKDVAGMTNLYFTLHSVATFCFAMSILYSLTLLLIMESVHGKDASDLSHALGVGIHWPITNFVVGILLVLAALFLKGFFDLSTWVWITGFIIISVMIAIYFSFLATGRQCTPSESV